MTDLHERVIENLLASDRIITKEEYDAEVERLMKAERDKRNQASSSVESVIVAPLIKD